MTSERAGDERNWAGNVTYSAASISAPSNERELVELIRGTQHVRALGSRHSFNDIADTDDVLVSLVNMPPAIELDGSTVRVSAGFRYGDIVESLHHAGVALANLASLPHISVGGAVQTGTHGSGDSIGSLATQVSALEMITAGGESVRIERGDDDFGGAVVALGTLGIVTHLELDVEATYEISQRVFDGGRWDAIAAALDDVTSAGDSVSIFTTWQSADDVDNVWVKSRTDRPHPDLTFIGAIEAESSRHPIPEIDPTPTTTQIGIPGPWYDRLPHFRLDFTPSVGDELQSEYIVDRSDAVATIAALRTLAPRIAALLHVCEVRTVAADDLWLSEASGRDSVCFHFTWHRDEASVREFLPELEAALPLSARPHWGKVFTLEGAALRERYPRWDDFVALRAKYDPDGRFDNSYLRRLFA
ncbi:xylitol oxidase [Microbacterium endophyticum]|uniref:Xylitol oxidase n=1 Tax=Microbacterium endophyticum TaxID=1526412 RepID=A0A7W4YN59_9MICO|nr:D-arabinono-1,4-lactone oxidase [Microbacterium endophyticum]MBB2975817.1 xylitol oxidase [Microbacterium endophyticum]NIK36300.1 xylitol oxidase [Microbacterium endophyticum]